MAKYDDIRKAAEKRLDDRIEYSMDDSDGWRHDMAKDVKQAGQDSVDRQKATVQKRAEMHPELKSSKKAKKLANAKKALADKAAQRKVDDRVATHESMNGGNTMPIPREKKKK